MKKGFTYVDGLVLLHFTTLAAATADDSHR